MPRKKDIHELIGHIYEASYNPDNWNCVLEGIADITESDSALLGYRDWKLEQASGIYSYNIAPETMRLYNEAGEDPHFSLFAEAVPIGVAAAVQDIVPDRKELEKIYGDTFNQILLDNDMYYIGGAVLFNDATRSMAIALQRGEKAGPWPEENLARLTELTPHIQRALHIHREFTRLRVREQALYAGLDRLLIGLILFDELCRPIYCNPLAESLLNSHPALQLRNDRLIATSAEVTEFIHEALMAAVQAPQNREVDPQRYTTALGLRHTDLDSPLPMLITPVGQAGLGLESSDLHGHAAVLLSDPDRNQPIVPEALVTAYGLTPAEAQVAIALSNGLTIDETAALHGTRASTVKSQMKVIFRKLGVNRQAELVKILLTGPFRVNF